MQAGIEARQVPGKGVGVFAVEDLPASELIIGETALLSVAGVEQIRSAVAQAHPALSDSLCSEDMRQLNAYIAADDRMLRACADALASLDAPDRGRFLALGDSFELGEHGLCQGMWVRLEEVSPENSDFQSAQGLVIHRHGDSIVVEVAKKQISTSVEKVHILLSNKTIPGIFLTNAVTLEGKDVAEVYPSFSRLNHSCSPNAQVIHADGMRGVFTTQPVSVGEEVCISYFDEAECMPAERLSDAARLVDSDAVTLHVGLVRQQLFSKWGFWCTCERCLPAVAEAEQALTRWIEIAQLET